MEKEYIIKYECYNCPEKWTEIYSCACDSECGECGARNIEAKSYKEIKGEN